MTWHNGSRTSRLAAEAAIVRAPSQQERVRRYIAAHPGCSRQDIADGTGISLQAVCARVGSLLAATQITQTGTKTGAYGTAVQALRITDGDPARNGSASSPAAPRSEGHGATGKVLVQGGPIESAD